jgi:hypothetical protein
MKRLTTLLGTVVALSGLGVYMTYTSGHADETGAPLFGVTLPPGYRDWKLISVAHEAGNNNDLRAVLGNDLAIKAYREGKLPYPDGSIIARLAWRYVSSTRSLAATSPSLLGNPSTFSSWSRTQRNTPRPAAGDSLNSKTANLTARRFSTLVFLATCRRNHWTISSPITHLDGGRSPGRIPYIRLATGAS